jgi:hypothetical protein
MHGLFAVLGTTKQLAYQLERSREPRKQRRTVDSLIAEQTQQVRCVFVRKDDLSEVLVHFVVVRKRKRLADWDDIGPQPRKQIRRLTVDANELALLRDQIRIAVARGIRLVYVFQQV